MGQQTETARAEQGLAEHWPGAKVGVEVCHFLNGKPIDSQGGGQRWRAAIVMPPALLKSWALSVMEALPDVSSRFPWTPEAAALATGSTGEDMKRGALTLGESQAMAAVLWALHFLHERSDAEQSEKVGSGLACQHAFQLPGSPASGGDPGSEGWLKVSFRFFRCSDGPFVLEKDPAVLATSMMFAALGRMGALVDDCCRVESRTMPPSWDPKSGGIWELAQLEGFRGLWEQIELALVSSQARPRPKSSPRTAL